MSAAAQIRPILSSAAFALGSTIACAALADPGLPDLGSSAPPAEARKKSYAIPAAEIVGFDFLLNRIDRNLYGREYAVTPSTIRRNLHSSWVVDNDPFKTNQLLHPYQGSMYHGFARSAGLDFWESLGYTFAGSAMWEIAGEDTLPSKNDQIASGIAGSFLGEALFRIASLVLEKEGGSSLWREVSAAAISPSTGFNRLAFGERFSEILNSNDPAYYSRVQIGTSATTQHQAGNSTEPKRNEVLADFSMDYGLPGKPGYRYTRPFDYFTFQVTASSANAVESMATRGLLFGTNYEAGENYRGIWGLYGSYEYIAPQLFRVSSTALSLGTTGELRLANSIVVQGTGLAGVGYAGVGTVHGTQNRDYHYGVTPQALLALRLIFGDRASLDVTAREFFVSGVAGAGTGGHDNIARADLSLTVRVQREHAIAVKYLWSRRDATFPNLNDFTQTRGTLGLYYVFLGNERFGAVDWR
ncbi:MAG TPA: DUF3943 domain-containing protein [Burkholderiales bacterium]|nr:DUF3943 domain-containing protein [Burkholderiales bacterium]